MAKQILDQVIVDDPFQLITSIDELTQYSHVIVSIDFYQEHRDALRHYSGQRGLRIGTDTDLETIAPWLPELSLIDIHYASFTDGRGHSLARLLRESYGFKGILRASGDVFKDTVFYQKRCGFNSFVVKETESLTNALQGLNVFSETYQAAYNEVPLFRRRNQQMKLSA